MRTAVLVLVALLACAYVADAKSGALKKLELRSKEAAKNRARAHAGVEVPGWCRDAAEVRRKAREGLAARDPDATCRFYTECVEPLYNCGSDLSREDNYPLNYGNKYCKRFAAHTWSSGKGRVWRDATLQCLQAALVPWVQSHRGSCAELTNFAFDSHVDCYTQVGASICELLRPSPADGGLTARGQDLVKITRTPDGSDLMTRRSARQMAGVVEECAGQVGNYAVDTVGEAANNAVEWARSLFDR